MRALYDSKSKLDDRGIKKLLTEESKVETWLKVEAALATAQAQVGIIPQEAADNIVANAKIENIDFLKCLSLIYILENLWGLLLLFLVLYFEGCLHCFLCFLFLLLLFYCLNFLVFVFVSLLN